MLRCIATLLACLLAGEAAHRLTGIHVNGPVIGMGLLVAWLAATGEPDAEFQATAGGVLKLLPMLFVPAGVGIVQHLPLLRREWFAIGVALLASTAVGLGVTGRVMQFVAERRPGRDTADGEVPAR